MKKLLILFILLLSTLSINAQVTDNRANIGMIIPMAPTEQGISFKMLMDNTFKGDPEYDAWVADLEQQIDNWYAKNVVDGIRVMKWPEQAPMETAASSNPDSCTLRDLEIAKINAIKDCLGLTPEDLGFNCSTCEPLGEYAEWRVIAVTSAPFQGIWAAAIFPNTLTTGTNLQRPQTHSIIGSNVQLFYDEIIKMCK